MAARTAIELLRALATKVGGKEVKNVFRQNLDDTFGKDEVKEVFVSSHNENKILN